MIAKWYTYINDEIMHVTDSYTLFKMKSTRTEPRIFNGPS